MYAYNELCGMHILKNKNIAKTHTHYTLFSCASQKFQECSKGNSNNHSKVSENGQSADMFTFRAQMSTNGPVDSQNAVKANQLVT